MTPQNSRIGNLQRGMLQELSAGDLLYGFLLSGHSTKRMYKLARERAASRYRRKRALEKLIAQRLVHKTGERIFLTAQGRYAMEPLAAATKKKLGQTAWDGKWRVVTFDIPEKHAGLRRTVRNMLLRAGFIRLQHSVWIFPHECEELIRLIQEETRLAPCVLYGVLERIETSGRLKKFFRL